MTTREEEDPAEFWGELLFFDHDRGAALDAASSVPGVSKSGSGDRVVEGNGDGDGLEGRGGNADRDGDGGAEGGSHEGKGGKRDGSATFDAAATFDVAFTSAAEKEANKAEEDLFDEDTVEEIIDMDAHPGFIKPAFDLDDCEPDCDDSEDGLNKKIGTVKMKRER